ncbi:MAG: BMC domain-containing protein [Myxococcales bacterium]|nr:BMC domain-containing protein [Myxococcales bacterium]
MTTTQADTLAALELRSVPAGLGVLDALVKEAVVTLRFAGDIDPSRFLLVFEGDLASVEAGLLRATEVAGDDLLESLLLPRAHADLRAALAGELTPPQGPAAEEQAIGVLQCHTVISTLAATDRALKSAETKLLRMRLATELAGQGHAVVCGEQYDVEAALEAATAASGAGVTVTTRLIPRAAPETFTAAAQRSLGARPLRPLDA